MDGNRQTDVCRNVWHRNPSATALISCPKCQMSLSEWKELQALERELNGVPVAQQLEGAASAAGPPVRIQMFGWESDKPEEALALANRFFNELANERNRRVVNTETHYAPNGKFVVIAAVALFF